MTTTSQQIIKAMVGRYGHTVSNRIKGTEHLPKYELDALAIYKLIKLQRHSTDRIAGTEHMDMYDMKKDG